MSLSPPPLSSILGTLTLSGCELAAVQEVEEEAGNALPYGRQSNPLLDKIKNEDMSYVPAKSDANSKKMSDSKKMSPRNPNPVLTFSYA